MVACLSLDQWTPEQACNFTARVAVSHLILIAVLLKRLACFFVLLLASAPVPTTSAYRSNATTVLFANITINECCHGQVLKACVARVL